MNTIVFDTVLPLPLIVFGGLAFVLLCCVHAATLSRGMSRLRRALLVTLRAVGVCTLLIVLLEPSKLVRRPPKVLEDVAWIGIDTSRSMRQEDADGASRIDAAIQLMREARLLPAQEDASRPALRYVAFHETLETVDDPETLEANGRDTRLHDVITEILNRSDSGAAARALFLLTDGHDFQLVSPARTGFAARSRHIPIYAVPLGAAGNVRDAAVRISGYPPFCHIRQTARIEAAIRLIGCEFEDLECQLLRRGQVVQRKQVDTDQAQQVAVRFDVTEQDVGQYEYEIRVKPLNSESDVRNNSAITYLNVLDQQIQVLLLEADPYWDTTFLQRSLRTNEKFNVLAFIKYSDSRVRCISSSGLGEELEIPSTAEAFGKYDLVIVGRRIDSLLDEQQLAALEEYVRHGKGTVVFSRGPAMSDGIEPLGIEPVVWGESLGTGGPVDVSRAGRQVAAFTMVANTGSVPDVIDAFAVRETKSLATTLAGLQDAKSGSPLPGFIHRRIGQGQVFSVGVTGLWRWALNQEAEGGVTLFDRFWDQLILCLLASHEILTDEPFALRINSANVLLGNKVYLRVVCKDPGTPVGQVSVSLWSGEEDVAKVTLAPAGPGRPATGEWLPPKPGRYSAQATFPNGARGRLQFVVYEENAEETDVAVDTLLLKRLCSSSGGRVLTAAELGAEIRSEHTERHGEEVRQEKISLWDRKLFLWGIGVLFAVEWCLRRRWGLC